MLAGGSEGDRAHWGVTAAPAYHYLNQSGTFALREVDDGEEYGVMRAAMTTMGIQEDSQAGLFDALAAILHLSNVAMADPAGATASLASAAAGGHGGGAGGAGGGGAAGGRTGSSSSASSRTGSASSAAAGAGGTGQCRFAEASADGVAAAARLLGVSVADLQSALTSKEIVVERKPIKTLFTLSQSLAALEALTKAIYGRLFLWLVWAINRQIRAPAGEVASFIGVLDIFGQREPGRGGGGGVMCGHPRAAPVRRLRAF
jgi:myosin heavy subunit